MAEFDTVADAIETKEALTDLCAWFLLCANVATTTEPHPILGNVPICDRCAAKVARLGE